MKRHILSLGLILMILGLHVDAQTLKNIHRHNLPVLQIPIDLIDKVETVDVDGIKTLRISKLFGEATQIPLAEIDSITHNIGSVEPEQLGEMRTASVMGVVRDANNVPVTMAIIRSPFGGEETRTDANGVFFLNNIAVYDKLGYITINKPGYHKGSRSFLPLDEGSNRVNIQLLHLTQSGSFNASTGGTITSGLLQLNFPANAIQHNGQPYSGTVRVFAHALDPSSPEMFDQMPGELLGGMNDSLRLLRSFGMASIELRDANMNELQLAEGSSATLTFNIPPALQVDAPSTIDWWSFDEALGYWKHEGLAQKQGNQYVGSASHFTWWNVDVPENFNLLHGTTNATSGEPISDAQVNIVTQTLGTGTIYSNSVGEFSGRVPKNQSLTLNLFLTCSTIGNLVLAHTENISSTTTSIESQIVTGLSSFFPVTGTVINCLGQPIESGYVTLQGQVITTTDGNFTFQTCTTGDISIRAVDISNPDTIRVSDVIIIQVESSGANTGNINACEVINGAIMDIDGNVYSTVLIGTQWWMAENLRTSRFSNGTAIPHSTDGFVWYNSLTPASCVYVDEYATSNEALFGKIYNGYTVIDDNNVCPSGWHVPETSEWDILIDYLGGTEIAGGKMKSVGFQHWNEPNFGATNESGFNGLPGGYVDDLFIGPDSGALGAWWSATDSFQDIPVIFVNSEASNIESFPLYYSHGVSIRCIKD
jgi:uncharacterized protein (TIGR02145 family)